MSGNHGMGGVYEGHDQRKYTGSSLQQEQKHHNINAAGYMPKDQTRVMNQMRSEDIQLQVDERYKNDPLYRAAAHGNQPSRGALTDADIKAAEAEILEKKKQQNTDSLPGKKY